MNAFSVGTPASTTAGISRTGSSWAAVITRLGATSTAESLAVASRHSRRPVTSERAAASDDPVPGLLKARNAVVPAEGRGHRVVEEAVRPLVGRDPHVGVDVDDAREHEEPGRVDHLPGGGGEATEIGLDRGDPPAVDGDVGARSSRPS